LTAQAWDQEAKQWHKHNQSMWDKGSRKEILPFLKQHFKPGMHLLDIGCSSGYSTFRLNALGYPTHGVDISQEMIELARSNYPQINFSQGNVANLEMASESLDGVLGINVLEF